MAARGRRPRGGERVWGPGRILLYALLGVLVTLATVLATAPATLIDTTPPAPTTTSAATGCQRSTATSSITVPSDARLMRASAHDDAERSTSTERCAPRPRVNSPTPP